jgi:hypothetical protein
MLAFLAGDYDGVIGWLGAAWIGLIAWGFWRWTTPGVASQPARRAKA